MSKLNMDEILELRKQGYSYGDIVKHYASKDVNVTRQGIKYYIDKTGDPLKSQKERRAAKAQHQKNQDKVNIEKLISPEEALDILTDALAALRERPVLLKELEKYKKAYQNALEVAHQYEEKNKKLFNAAQRLRLVQQQKNGIHDP